MQISYYVYKSKIVGLEAYIRHVSVTVKLVWPQDFNHLILFRDYGPRKFIQLTAEDEDIISMIYFEEGIDSVLQYLLTYLNVHLTFES
jgi:hypothetical protein